MSTVPQQLWTLSSKQLLPSPPTSSKNQPTTTPATIPNQHKYTALSPQPATNNNLETTRVQDRAVNNNNNNRVETTQEFRNAIDRAPNGNPGFNRPSSETASATASDCLQRLLQLLSWSYQVSDYCSQSRPSSNQESVAIKKVWQTRKYGNQESVTIKDMVLVEGYLSKTRIQWRTGYWWKWDAKMQGTKLNINQTMHFNSFTKTLDKQNCKQKY